MESGQTLLVVFTVVVVPMLGGLALVAYSLVSRQRMRELAMRERIAMIERGLVPPPEVDPARFERAVSPVLRPANAKGQRYRSAGVMLIGLGIGLLLLIGFAAGAPEVAFGIGGGLAVLGAAVFVNGVLVTRDTDRFGDISIHPRTPGPPPHVGP